MTGIYRTNEPCEAIIPQEGKPAKHVSFKTKKAFFEWVEQQDRVFIQMPVAQMEKVANKVRNMKTSFHMSWNWFDNRPDGKAELEITKA